MYMQPRCAQSLQKSVVVAVTLFGVFVDLGDGLAGAAGALLAASSSAAGACRTAEGVDPRRAPRWATTGGHLPHADLCRRTARDPRAPGGLAAFKFSMAMNFIVFISQVTAGSL